ncbi:MAG: trigger factor [Tannerella sp.]|jgi:trigger factor|nr:trigger factor [Tannerella sp.]
MNVSLKNNDAASGVLKVEIEKNDYAESLDKNLYKLRRQANMPGFRKGMVPLSIVKKLYGKQALAEEVNKLVRENLYAYIRDNNIKVIGEPIPNENEQRLIDFDKDENFEFYFDVALSPDIDFELTKEDKLTFYKIAIDDELLDKRMESYRKDFGSYDKVDKVEGMDDLVKGDITELENGEPKTGGIFVEQVMLMPSYIKNETEQKKLIGAELNGKIVFNPYQAYEGEEKNLAQFFMMDIEKVKDLKNDFTFEIKEIIRHKPAELNQEFFDRIYDPGTVQDEAAFRDKEKESLSEQFLPESNSLFIKDVRALLLKKVEDIVFADDILKRWMLLSDEKMEKEYLEEDYPKIVEDLKYHYAKDRLIKENDIKVEKEELEDYVKRAVKIQYMQYGMMSMPDNVIENVAKDVLKKEGTEYDFTNRILNEKIISLLKEKITVTVKEITSGEFDEIVRKVADK